MKMNCKGFFAAGLAVVLAIPGFMVPVSANSETAADSVETALFDKSFIPKVRDLVDRNREEDYFSSIILDVAENTIQVDNQPAEKLEHDIQLQNKTAGNGVNNLLIPVMPVLAADKTQATASKNKNQIMLQDEEGQKEISLNGTVNDGKHFASSGAGEEQVLLTVSEIKREFNYEIIADRGKVIITNPYQAKRIFVKTKSGFGLPGTFGAAETVTDGKGMHALQYDSERETKAAYAALKKAAGLELVSLDTVVKADSIQEVKADWSTQAVQSKRYMEYLDRNNYHTDMVVAVIDSGLDTAHEMVKGRCVQGYDFVEGKTEMTDPDGHGTHVSGTVVANTPNTVKVMPLRVLNDEGYGFEWDIAEAIYYASDNGAKVINLSLGGFCLDKDSTGKCLEEYAIQEVYKNGTAVVASAGNESADTKYFCPAGIEPCITVAAADANGNTAYFSNFGDAVDITAPGVDVLSSVPGNEYEYYSGTSMAAPHVSAAMAMLYTKSPGSTPYAVERQLKKAVQDALIQGWDKYYGEGMLNLGIALGDTVTQAKKITLYNDTVNCYLGPNSEPAYIYVQTEPEASMDKAFAVTSSNPEVALFDGQYVVPLTPGETTLTFTLTNGKNASCNVVVHESDLWIDYATSSYAGGRGTMENPYLIRTAKQLAKLAKDTLNRDPNPEAFEAVYYKQIADIDLAGKEWVPINYNENGLKDGYFLQQPICYDGDGYTISNLTGGSQYPVGSNYGLFSVLYGNVSNLNLTDVEIYGADNTGGIAGMMAYGAVQNCTVNGRIEGFGNVGGIAGNMYGGGLVLDSSSSGTVNAFYNAGGIAGGATSYYEYDRVINCFSNMHITADSYAGGIVGYSLGVDVYNSYFTGDACLNNKEYNSFGGIMGGMNMSWEALEYVLSDEADPDSTAPYPQVVNCFSTTSLIGEKYCGQVRNCYYMNSSRPVRLDESEDVTDVRQKDLAFFLQKNNYLSASYWDKDFMWDFYHTWEASEKSLPVLRNAPLNVQPQVLDILAFGVAKPGEALTARLIGFHTGVVPSVYHWQRSQDGETWETIFQSVDMPGITYTVTEQDRGYYFRLMINYTIAGEEETNWTSQVFGPAADYGDVDLDGGITIKDVTVLQKYLAQQLDFDERQIYNGDFDRDGSLTIKDATAVQKYVAGIWW